MSLSETKFKKYNVFMPKLFNLIINLNEEQQRFMRKKVENCIFNEKRASGRKVCRIPMRYATCGRIYNDFIINIGHDGCFIETQRPLSVREEILMDIQSDGYDKPLRTKGEVAHANRLGIGIEFKDGNNDISDKLNKLLIKLKI